MPDRVRVMRKNDIVAVGVFSVRTNFHFGIMNTYVSKDAGPRAFVDVLRRCRMQ